MRRSSSIHLPLRANKPDELNPLDTGLKVPSASGSHYESTISMAAGASSLLNLYPAMARYRCCCGLCRLRTAAFIIAWICIFISIIAIAAYWVYGTILPVGYNFYIGIAITVLCTYQIISCILLQIGVIFERHMLILPFLINCVIAVMSSMSICMILLVSTDRKLSRIYPLFAAVSISIVAIYLYFLVTICMTFVMYRDKKRCSNG